MVEIHAGGLRQIASIFKLYLIQSGVQKAPFYLALTIHLRSAAIFSVLEMQHSPFCSAIFGNFIMQKIVLSGH